MDLLIGIMLVFASAGGLLVLALVVRERERTLGRRVEAIAHATLRKVRPEEGGPTPARLGRALIGLRQLFAFRMRRSWGVSANPVYLLLAGVVAAAAIWFLGRVPAHLPAYVPAAGAAGGFLLVPRFILVHEQHRADRQFAALLPDAIDMVVRIVRAGLPVGGAIRTVGEEADPPLGMMFAEIANQNDIGVPLEEAMARTGDVVDNPDFRFFAVAVALQQSTGGNLAATLETLSDIIRRQRAVRLKAGAAIAEVKMSALVLGSIPFVVAGVLVFVAPGYLSPLFGDPRGNIILGLAVFGLLLAAITIRAMIRNSLRI